MTIFFTTLLVASFVALSLGLALDVEWLAEAAALTFVGALLGWLCTTFAA